MMQPSDYTLLLQALDAELSTEAQNTLDQLLVTDSASQEAWDTLQRMRQLLANTPRPAFKPNFEDRIMAQLASRDTTSTPRTTLRRVALSRYPAWLAMAAGFALLIGVGLAFWLVPRTVTAPLGQMASVVLPDGSNVELSSGTTLRYQPFWGRAERRVQLEGEAFFDVEKAGTPFIVETFNTTVTVKGTRFNVRTWPDAHTHQTDVAVESGLVAITALAYPKQEVLLRPAQRSYVKSDATMPALPTAVQLDYTLAWRSGALAFRDQSLASVITELERRFAIEISLKPATLAQERVAYFNLRPASIEAVLTDICSSQGLRYQKTAQGFQIVKP